MDYRYLGRSALKISPLCLGAMMFGGETDEVMSKRIIDKAYDQGINFIDTADVYHAGRSEEAVGRAIAERRDSWVIATKFGYPATQGPNEQGQSRKWIIQSVEASLKRMGTDYIDILYFHRSLSDAPLEEGVRAIADLIRQGKIRYFGVSNFRGWRIAEIARLADQLGIDRPIASQPLYNIVDRTAEVEQLRFFKAAATLLKEFSESKSPAVVRAKIEWNTFSLVQDVVTDEQVDAADLQAQGLLAICESYEPALQSERAGLSSELEALRAIKLQFAAVVKSGKQAKAQETLSKRLKAVLNIVEAQRKAYVDQALASITQRVDSLYAKLHPGEKLGDIKLQLDPNKRGSLNVSSRFESKTGIPPQAYYSEAHMDTLGICIFIALAEKDVAANTLLVLDDVLTSADQPHVDRFISVIHEELTLPVLITTHYRPWRDRYRYATGPVGNVHLIELLSWTQERGVRHTKTKLEIDQLRALLAIEPIDRQALASKAGVLLEAALRELCIQYKCKMSFNAEGQHTLGEYLNGIDSKLRKLMKCVTNINSVPPTTPTQASTDILPLLAAVDSMTWIRNQVGGHFNLSGMDLTDAQINEFAKSTCSLLDALICLQCGELPRKNTGSFFACTCKGQELHPLTSPGASAAQTGN